MDNITAIIVSYNTPDLLRECYESLHKFYPDMRVIIIDGSEKDNPCWHYSKSLNGGPVLVKNVEYNIGHGNGMKMGISMCETEYFLLMDSDVVIRRPVLGILIRFFEQFDIYGIGQVIHVDENGHNMDKGYRYLHPHFALIKKSEYLKFDPIIHHGAPLIKNMISGAEAGVKNFDLSTYITHKSRGTRDLNPPGFHPGNWDKLSS